MKLKGISKLVLAGTALAATAATLTTSTYAWYVSNTTVTATGVQGSVAGSSIDGSLFIAKNKAFAAVGEQGQEGYIAAHEGPDKYITDIQLTPDATTGYTETTLDPQSKAKLVDSYYYYKTKDASKGEKTYYKQDGSNSFVPATEQDTDVKLLYERSAQSEGVVWCDKDGKKIDSAKLITFKFWLKSSSAGTAAVTFMVDNTTTSATTQMALSGGSGVLPTGKDQGDTFTADAVHALRMEVFQKNGDAQETSATYAVSEIAKNAAGTDAYTTAGSKAVTTNGVNLVTGGDANKYYFNVLGTAPYNTTAGSGASTDANTRTAAAWENVTLVANTDTLLTFKIWLEGSDADCWDSVRGQSFTFDFSFAFTPASGE